jgi:hypothetical protein
LGLEESGIVGDGSKLDGPGDSPIMSRQASDTVIIAIGAVTNSPMQQQQLKT